MESLRFDTMPSSPILQAWAKTVGPSPLDMLMEPDAGASLGEHARKRGLANLKRIAPQVVVVQLDEVEGVLSNAVPLPRHPCQHGNSPRRRSVPPRRSSNIGYNRTASDEKTDWKKNHARLFCSVSR